MAGGTQRVGFALLQARERRRLRDGGASVEGRAGERTLTSLVRLPAGLAHALAAHAEALPGPRRAYPPERLHLTVLNLGHPPADGARAETAARILAAGCPFEVTLRGLGLSRWSLYARAYDPTGELRAARARLAGGLDLHPPRRLRTLGFVTLARFAAGADLRDLARAVRARRGTELGGFEATTVEIVRTDRLFAAAATTVVRTVDLRGS